jgi:hypothetical protein
VAVMKQIVYIKCVGTVDISIFLSSYVDAFFVLRLQGNSQVPPGIPTSAVQ